MYSFSIADQNGFKFVNLSKACSLLAMAK